MWQDDIIHRETQTADKIWKNILFSLLLRYEPLCCRTIDNTMQTHNTLKQLNYVKTNYSTRIHSGIGIDVPQLRLQHQKKRQDRKKNRKAQLGQIHIPCT